MLLTCVFGLICMSDRGLPEAIDHLATALAQLSLAIRPAPSSPRGSDSGWLLVDPSLPVEPGSRVGSGPPASSTSVAHHSSLSSAELTSLYNSLEAAIPALPSRCVHACRALTGSGSSPEARATRAWVAGHWARLVLADSVPTPRPSPKLPTAIRPRIYIVLRASAFEGAARFSSFNAFKSAVGPLENSSTVCHAFASLAEAEVYCEAAGFDLPAER